MLVSESQGPVSQVRILDYAKSSKRLLFSLLVIKYFTTDFIKLVAAI